MPDSLREHNAKVSTGGRNITNRCFDNDIDALAEKVQEIEGPIQSLDKIYTR